MRRYFSDGVTSEEMLVQKAVELKAGVGLQGVGRSVAEVKRQGSDAQFSSPSSRNAWQLRRDFLLAELASFGALMDVTVPCVNSLLRELGDSK